MKHPNYGFADIHIHIMPGVDDGSESMEMTRRMFDIAMEQQIETMILTPHYKRGHHNVSPEVQMCRIGDMNEMQRETYPDDSVPDLYPGNEIMYDSDVLEDLENGRIKTLADSSYILVEFRPWEQASYVREALRSLACEGYRVILAHCERYECLHKDYSLIENLYRNRIYLQVNADDVLPRFMAPVQRFVHRLLEDQLVSFVGTDAHKDQGRTPRMLECWNHLERHCDPDYVRDIMRENTLRVIRNEEV